MGEILQLDYYYGIEAEQFSFYRVPRLLIKDERFKKLSSDAKLLYGLMLDRMSLSSSHLEYVIGCMKETTTKITNIKSYMITALYNAPATINHFYQQEVQHDMYGGGWHEKGII